MKSSCVLEVKDLSVRFKNDQGIVDVVHHISFSIDKGKTVGLVGESGSGKSVTALAIMKLLPYPMASHPTGEVYFQGEELIGKTEQDMCQIRGRKISMIFQEPMMALNPLHPIGKQIGEVLVLHRPDLSLSDIHDRIVAVLDLVGFHRAEERLHAYPHELSGGERQRVMIAIAVVAEPDLIIADEPTTAVDVTTQSAVLDLLKELQKKLGLTLILITHDLSVVRKMAHRVIVMKSGSIVEQGAVKDVFENPTSSYTKMLIHARPQGSPASLSEKASVLLAVNSLSVRLEKKKFFFRKKEEYQILKDVSFDLLQGETLGIVGESGSGKTTLALALLGLIKSKGTFCLSGVNLQALTPRQWRPYRRHIQIVFQDPFGALNPRLTVGDIVSEGLKQLEPSLGRESVKERVIHMLGQVGLEKSVCDRYPHEFSGGQRQRIALARALILSPQLLILDEPTSALDRAIQKDVLELLLKLQRDLGLSYIFITHDLQVVKSMSHKIIVMKEGRIVEAGDTLTLFKQPKESYTKILLEASLVLEEA